jgi:hypothetical protein
MVYIYVLKLQNNKYYVGKTNNPQFRLENHFNSQGAEWTRLHKPVSLEALISNCDDYDEDKYTRMYMDKYGVDNVRGGSYTQVNLDKGSKEQLTRMSNGTNNRCFTCGKQGHFANNCTTKTAKYNINSKQYTNISYNNNDSDDSEYDDSEYDDGFDSDVIVDDEYDDNCKIYF